MPAAGPVTTRFCLVTHTHISNNPRLVKEADALFEAGCGVRVVAANARPDHAARDAVLMRGRRWTLHTVRVARSEWRSKPRWLVGSCAQAVARRAFDAGIRSGTIRDQAASRFIWQLAAAAASAPADIVIGHNLQALPAAARAVRLLGARLGFDIEDLHTAEVPDDEAHRGHRRLIASVESHYLPRCAFLTASSEGIADEIGRLYGVRRPRVILNVFPAAERRSIGGVQSDRIDDRPSLYWYSQVVGPGRGLEDALRAVPLLGTPVQLHIRGEADPDYGASLRRLIAELGIGASVYFHPPAAAGDLVALASGHDVGFALEELLPLNRALCVTNKLFTYMLAGLAVAVTDTPGQRAVLADAPDAGILFPPGDPAALATALRPLLSPARLARAKQAALASALSRFCWERERERLLEYLLPEAPRWNYSLGESMPLFGTAS